MAKKEPTIADLISVMQANKSAQDGAEARRSDDAHKDAVMIKGSMDDINASFGQAFAKKVGELASEREKFEHSGLLDQIRMGVDGMKLTWMQGIKRWMTDFGGLMPGRKARENARQADLATKLVAIDTQVIAQTSMDMLAEMTSGNAANKIGMQREAERAKAFFGAKSGIGKTMALMGRGIGFLTGQGGKEKEKQNEERRHKSRHITLLEAILAALGGKAVEDDDEGGGEKGKWGKWGRAFKKFATIAGILIGLAIAPFVFFGSFVKQLGVETKAIGAWIKKTAQWGKGTFFNPIKNAFNRIMKTGTWADDFKKSFDTKWKNFKTRFTPTGLIGVFERFKMRLNAMKINVNTSIDDALKAFQKTKIGANVSAVFSNLRTKFNNTLSRLTSSVNRAAGGRVGGRPPGRGGLTSNPFRTLRTSLSTAQANMSTKIAGWGQAFTKSPMVQKLGTMFNTLKAPFIAVQEFLMGKKAARPAGMPPMLAAAPKTGGIMGAVRGIGSFFRTVGGAIMKIPGIGLVLKPAMFLGRMFGKLFLPLTLLFGIFDGVGQWKSDEGFSEETKPKTIMGKIMASVNRAFSNLAGMFIDLPLGIITWIMDKAGLGKETVVVAGRELKQDAPWMQKLKAFNFSDLLFGFIWKIGSIPGQIVGFIGDLMKDPLGTIKGIFNSQWVKDNIWDGGSEAAGLDPANPRRLFGIPLVMPNLGNIKWPDWGEMFREYVYDGTGENIKIFGIELKFPSLSMPNWSDILPDWLKSPKEWFGGWFKGVKSFFGFGDEDKVEEAITEVQVDAKLTGIRESIESLIAHRKKLEAEWSSFKDKAGAGHTSGMSYGAYYSQQMEQNRAAVEMMKRQEQTRLEELANGVVPSRLGTTPAPTTNSMMNDNRQTHVSNIHVDAGTSTTDGTTYVPTNSGGGISSGRLP